MAVRDPVTGTPLAFLSAAVRYCFPDDFQKWIPGQDFAFPGIPDYGEGINTGSTATHLDLPLLIDTTSMKPVSLTDIDYMCIVNPPHWNLLVETQRIHPSLNPGFCYLRLKGLHTGVPYIEDLDGQYIHKKSYKSFQDAVEFNLRETGVNTIDHPEIGLKIMEQMNNIVESDVVFCIPIPWPAEATEWTTRKRKSGWPSKDLVHDCVTPGCHVVKKAHPLSTRPSIEWRFSFSIAEKKLGLSLTNSQRVCFKVLKALIKLENSGVTEGFATYYLLTTLFWVCEEVPTSHWNTSSLGNMLLCLLDKLLLFLTRRYLPNYFIPKANLIGHVTEEVIRRWSNGILSVRMNPITKLIDFHSKFVVMQGTILLCRNMVAGLKELLTKQKHSFNTALHSFLKTIALQYACDYRHDMVLSLGRMILSLGCCTEVDWSLGYKTEAYLLQAIDTQALWPTGVDIEADMTLLEKMDFDNDSECFMLLHMYIMLLHEVVDDKICTLNHLCHIRSYTKLITILTLLTEVASLIYQSSKSVKLNASGKHVCLEHTQKLFQRALEYPPCPNYIKVKYAQILMTQNLHEEALDILKEVVNGDSWGGTETCPDVFFSRFTAECMDDILRADLAGNDFVGYDIHALVYFLLLRCYTELKRPFTAEEVPPASEFRERFVTELNPMWAPGFLHLEGCFCLSKGHVYHALRVFLSEILVVDSVMNKRVWYCVARLYLDFLPKVEQC